MGFKTLFVVAALATVAYGYTVTNSCRCGQKNPARTVGGVDADVNEWPWQAGLLSDNGFVCGGSLLNDRYVLTAAQCVQDYNAGDLTVFLSDHTLSIPSETDTVFRSVDKIIVHENYVPGDELNDIAILKLSSPVEVSSTLLPVCLPPPRPLYSNNREATATGWGTLSSGPSGVSDVLKEVVVPVVSPAACRSKYGASRITDLMLCAGETGKASCLGDTGGPLVFRDGGNNYDQIGVTSWGAGCGAPGYPGVYTRVNKYLDWIDANTKDGIYCTGFNPIDA